MERELLNARELHLRLGLSLPTVADWRDRGCPHHGSGRGIRYDPVEVAEWARAAYERGEIKTYLGGATPETERETAPEAAARLKTAQADLAELRVAQERSLLVPRDEVSRSVGELLFALRKRLLALPDRLAPYLENAPRADISDRLAAELTEVLAACAESPYGDEDATGNGIADS